MVVKDMELGQKGRQFIPEELETTALELDSPESYEARSSKFANLIRRPRGYLLGLVFVVGLLLGWLVIGWWLWPVQWTNSDPWLLRPRYQRTFVHLVAEDLWRTGDVSATQEALAGWDQESLVELLTRMQNEASSSEERQHLAALAEALEMPDTEEALMSSLLNQKTILLSSILSALPLVAAIALAVCFLVQDRTQRTKAIWVGEKQLEEAPAEVLDREEERKARQEQGEQPVGEEEGEKEEEEEGEGQEREREEEDGTESDEWEEDEEIEDEEEIESTPWVQDLLSDFFDDDDTEIPRLKALCEHLPDVDAADLLEQSRKIVDDLRKSNALHYGEG